MIYVIHILWDDASAIVIAPEGPRSCIMQAKSPHAVTKPTGHQCACKPVGYRLISQNQRFSLIFRWSVSFEVHKNVYY